MAAHEQRSASLLLLAGAVVFCAIQLGILVPNHDIAWLLELSRRMLNGGKYYTDFYELNPPLYPILLLPVDLLSRFTGAAAYTLLVVGVSGLIYYISLKLFSCLPSLAPDSSFRGRISLALCLQAGLFFLPGYDFGQRDPVALYLTLPLLCWFSAERTMSYATREIVLAAVLAALGVLIKPYLAAVVILILAVRIVATRRVVELLVPVVLPALAVTVAYVILILEVFPEWLVMAHVAGDSYQMYDIHTYVPQWFISALVLIVMLAAVNEYLQSSLAARRGARYFVAAAVGALASYLVQRKGFSYHLAPTKIMLGFLLAITGVAILQRLRPVIGERVYLQRALLVSLAISLLAFGEDVRSLLVQHDQARFYASLAAKLREVHAGDRLFFFTTGLAPEFPLNLYYNFTPSSRFPCLWTLPAAVVRENENGNGPRTRGATARSDELRNLVAEDFRRWAPTAFVVNVSDRVQGMDGHFEFLPWFRLAPQMRDILNRYQFASLVPSSRAQGTGVNETYAIYVLRERRTAFAQAAVSSED